LVGVAGIAGLSDLSGRAAVEGETTSAQGISDNKNPGEKLRVAIANFPSTGTPLKTDVRPNFMSGIAAGAQRCV
jgi:hypothetical protein